MTLHPKWISVDFWACRAHIPAARLPAVQDTCYYCGAERPAPQQGQVIPRIAHLKNEHHKKVLRLAVKQEKEQAKAEVEAQNRVGTQPCSWSGCANKAREGSLYCSRDCSNKNARARHAARKIGSGTHAIAIDPATGPDITVATTVRVDPEGQIEVVKSEVIGGE